MGFGVSGLWGIYKYSRASGFGVTGPMNAYEVQLVGIQVPAL